MLQLKEHWVLVPVLCIYLKPCCLVDNLSWPIVCISAFLTILCRFLIYFKNIWLFLWMDRCIYNLIYLSIYFRVLKVNLKFIFVLTNDNKLCCNWEKSMKIMHRFVSAWQILNHPVSLLFSPFIKCIIEWIIDYLPRVHFEKKNQDYLRQSTTGREFDLRKTIYFYFSLLACQYCRHQSSYFSRIITVLGKLRVKKTTILTHNTRIKIL